MNALFSDYNYSEYTSDVADLTRYSDIDLSLRILPNRSDIYRITDIDAIKNSVRNLCLTSPAERPFQPNLGTRLNRLLFENVNVFTEVAIANEINETLRSYEPRLAKFQTTVKASPDTNSYAVTVVFTTKNFAEATVELILRRLR